MLTATACTDLDLARTHAALTARLLAHCALSNVVGCHVRAATGSGLAPEAILARLLGVAALLEVLAREGVELKRLEECHDLRVWHLHPAAHPRHPGAWSDRCGV